MFITLLVFQVNKVACFFLEPSFFKFSFFSRLNHDDVNYNMKEFANFYGSRVDVTRTIIAEKHPPACREQETDVLAHSGKST